MTSTSVHKQLTLSFFLALFLLTMSCFDSPTDTHTPIEEITLIAPANEAIGVEHTPTFTWTGGDDPDGDAVFFKVYYGTKTDSLSKETSEKNERWATINTTHKLDPFITYYWQVVAYSKVNNDSSKSAVRSFTTQGIAPAIIRADGLKDQTLSSGQTLTLGVEASGTPVPTFQWFHKDIKITGATSDTYIKAKITRDDEGEYYVIISNGINPDNTSKKVTVTIDKTAPTITIPPVAEDITYGQTLESAKLTGGKASVGGVFAFTTPTTIPSFGTTNHSVTFTPIDTARYHSVPAGSVSVTTQGIAPAITKAEGLEDQLLNVGQNLILAVEASGTPLPTFQWFHKDVKITGATSDTYIKSKITRDDEGEYYVVISNGINPDKTSKKVTVTIDKTAPTITTPPVAEGIAYGQTLESAKLTGGQASVDGVFAFTTPTTVPSLGTTNHSVTFTPVDTVQYHSVPAGSVSVATQGIAPAITKADGLEDQTLSFGQTLTLGVEASGTPVPTFQWFHKDIKITGATSDTYIKAKITRDDEGEYYVVISNGINPDKTSKKVTVTIGKAAPTITTPPVAESIAYGQILERAKLTGGQASVDGVFTFTTPTTVPSLGTTNHLVTFTPVDTAQYLSVPAGSVSVIVGPVTDADNNEYTTVVIGAQEWTVENLRTTKYQDGTPIPHVPDSAAWATLSTPGYCWYNNTTDADFQQKYGALYNWYTVETGKLAPQGWRVATDEDWKVLENYLIANGYNHDGTTTGNKIGKAMATTDHWGASIVPGAVGNNQSMNNKSGFSGIPGGCRWDNADFSNQSYYVAWWSSTENGASDAWSFNLYYAAENLTRFNIKKNFGFSVRLVRDLN